MKQQGRGGSGRAWLAPGLDLPRRGAVVRTASPSRWRRDTERQREGGRESERANYLLAQVEPFLADQRHCCSSAETTAAAISHMPRTTGGNFNSLKAPFSFPCTRLPPHLASTHTHTKCGPEWAASGRGSPLPPVRRHDVARRQPGGIIPPKVACGAELPRPGPRPFPVAHISTRGRVTLLESCRVMLR